MSIALFVAEYKLKLRKARSIMNKTKSKSTLKQLRTEMKANIKDLNFELKGETNPIYKRTFNSLKKDVNKVIRSLDTKIKPRKRRKKKK